MPVTTTALAGESSTHADFKPPPLTALQHAANTDGLQLLEDPTDLCPGKCIKSAVTAWVHTWFLARLCVVFYADLCIEVMKGYKRKRN